jgi:hypothetical protein
MSSQIPRRRALKNDSGNYPCRCTRNGGCGGGDGGDGCSVRRGRLGDHRHSDLHGNGQRQPLLSDDGRPSHPAHSWCGVLWCVSGIPVHALTQLRPSPPRSRHDGLLYGKTPYTIDTPWLLSTFAVQPRDALHVEFHLYT